MIKAGIICVALCGLGMCVFWYPFYSSLCALGGVGPDLDPVTPAQSVTAYVMLTFYIVTSVPCFAVLGFSWKVASLIAKNELFTEKASVLLERSAVLLFADLAVFLIGNAVFCFTGTNVFAVFYFAVAAFGFIFAALLAAASRFTGKAAELREENEAII